MADYARELATAYFGCLQSYVTRRDEQSLETAATLGRRALSAGLGVLDVTLMHHESLAVVLSAAESAAERRRILESASLLLCEALGRFEMTHLGFEELQREISEAPMIGIAFCRELQGPYQSIMAALTRLDEITPSRRGAARSRLFANMLSSAEILGRRIDDLAELVGFRTGLFTVEQRNVDFREILDSVRRKMEHAYGNAFGSSVHFTVGKLPRAVRLDGERITKVLATLLRRAVESSAPELRTEMRVFAAEESLIVEVESHEADSSLWERMGRILSNHPGAWVGKEIAGLGSDLALCLEIVRFHRGHLRIESEAGKSTLVRLELPAANENR